MISLRGFAKCLSLAALLAACGPSEVVDVTFADGGGNAGDLVRDRPGDRQGDHMDGIAGTGGAGGTGSGPGGTGGTGGGSVDMAMALDVGVDRPLDQPRPDVPPPPLDTAEVGPEAPAAAVALLVVANAAAPTMGDGQLRTALMARALTVRLASATAPADVSGVALVVIASSCPSEDVAGKYRNVTVPVLVAEVAVLDEMGMTGPNRETHYDENDGNQVTITAAGHPMAAGLTGSVTVVSQNSALNWGVPAASAEKVASFEGMAARPSIFGYPKGAMMTMGMAPARRVCFFATDGAAARLTAEGKKLLDAAIEWSLRP